MNIRILDADHLIQGTTQIHTTERVERGTRNHHCPTKEDNASLDYKNLEVHQSLADLRYDDDVTLSSIEEDFVTRMRSEQDLR